SLFSNDTATIPFYTLSLHDALPISALQLFNLFTCQLSSAAVGLSYLGTIKAIDKAFNVDVRYCAWAAFFHFAFKLFFHLFFPFLDRKSTRLNSSHVKISYAVFCLKKKKIHKGLHRTWCHPSPDR